MKKNIQIEKPNTVLAISAGSSAKGPFKAVLLRKAAADFELIWTRHFDDDRLRLDELLADLSTELDAPDGEHKTPVVISLDSGSIAFYRIELPPVKGSQLEEIIKMQAQALLPLPADEMYLTWRIDKTSPQETCTIAAARKETFRTIFNSAINGQITGISPDAEGIVNSWRHFFGGNNSQSVLIYLEPFNSRIILAENGKLSRSVTLDIGQDDLVDTDTFAENAELFTHDLRSAIDDFGITNLEDCNLYILAEDQVTCEGLIAHLQDAQLNPQLALPRANNVDIGFMSTSEDSPIGSCQLFAAEGELSPSDVYQYMQIIGTATIALNGYANTLNMLQAQLDDTQKKTASAQTIKTILAFVAAVAMIVVCLVIAKSVDKAELAKYQNSDLGKLIKQKDLRELIEQERPDIVDLLTKLNECGMSGMMIDNFSFQKGKGVTIQSFIRSREQLFEFQKKLQEQNGISNVVIQSSPYDEKQKRINFKMTFDYKHFSKKKK